MAAPPTRPVELEGPVELSPVAPLPTAEPERPKPTARVPRLEAPQRIQERKRFALEGDD